MLIRIIIRYYNTINDINESFITSAISSDFTTQNDNILKTKHTKYQGQSLRCLSVCIQPWQVHPPRPLPALQRWHGEQALCHCGFAGAQHGCARGGKYLFEQYPPSPRRGLTVQGKDSLYRSAIFLRPCKLVRYPFTQLIQNLWANVALYM